ncbi:MAG: NAD(P)-dependent oxidoreductase [Chitinophagales bacterium]
MAKIKFGVIRECKNPPDSRVPFPPKMCKQVLDKYGDRISLSVQRSPNRCFSDAEYEAENINLVDDVSDCDILFGVKEVPISNLIANKKFLFFSHTIKAQPYNSKLLQSIIKQNIQLIDYECLRYENGKRIIGFGRFAGIVGAHNGLRDYGLKTGAFSLPEAHKSKDYDEIKAIYDNTKLPNIKIAVTGGGRVSLGAKEVLDILNIKEVSPQDFLQNDYDKPVYVMLDIEELYRHKTDNSFNRKDFYQNPENYDCIFEPYTKETDFMINGIYWNPQAPIFFSKADMRATDFNIKVIADITCDINGSIPATTKATIIGDSTFGYDVQTEAEVAPYLSDTVDIMSIDNLPNELPRDASEMFGTALFNHIIPELLATDSAIIEKASIAKNGDLTEKYEYLRDYANGK